MRSAVEATEFGRRTADQWDTAAAGGFNAQQPSKPSFPIVALEMLTQRVPQIHNNAYGHGVTTAGGESKSSPLALLAATCSSIGKSESGDRSKSTTAKTGVASSLLPMSSDGAKSSFKPYKMESVSSSSSSGRSCASSVLRPSPPICSSGPMHGSMQTSSELDFDKPKPRYGIAPSEGPFSERDPMGVPHPSAIGSSGFLFPKNPMAAHAPYHCANEMGCSHCHSVRGMGETASSPVSPVIGGRPLPLCMCATCLQSRTPPASEPGLAAQKPLGSQYCHYQSPYGHGHAQARLFGGAPPAAMCRDPHCYDCVKAGGHSSSSLENPPLHGYMQPSLSHQCNHSKPLPYPSIHRTPPRGGSPPGLPAGSYGYDGGPKPVQSATSPFVCNWVADSKHCGRNFGSSEELLQHLRTHTSQRQISAASLAPPPVPIPPFHEVLPPTAAGNGPPCTVHGCQCHLNSKLVRTGVPSGYMQYSGHPYRYQPYGRPQLPLAGGNPAAGYNHHNIFHF